MARNNRIPVDAFLNRSCATDVPFDSMLLNGTAPNPFSAACSSPLRPTAHRVQSGDPEARWQARDLRMSACRSSAHWAFKFQRSAAKLVPTWVPAFNWSRSIRTGARVASSIVKVGSTVSRAVNGGLLDCARHARACRPVRGSARSAVPRGSRRDEGRRGSLVV